MRKDLRVWIFDPTLDQGGRLEQSAAHQRARNSGYNFVPLGLAYRNGILVMADGGSDEGISGQSLEGNGMHQASRRYRELLKVPVRTLPWLMKKAGVDSIDILKVSPTPHRSIARCSGSLRC